MSVVIKIEWLGGHEVIPSTIEGSYVQSFDVDANDGRGDLVVTFDKKNAKQFDNGGEAVEFWRQQSTVHPIRETDGKPNRPLTAYTISIERVE